MNLAYSDKEIIQGITNGTLDEEKYLKFLYKKNRDVIFGYIKKNSGSEEEAKDVFQDGIISLYENIKENRYNGDASLSSYLYSICRFIWLNKLKRKGIEQKVINNTQHSEIDPGPLPDLISEERRSNIMKLFDEIGEQCKEILIYSIYQNLSMDEIYQKMGFQNAQVARNKKYKCAKRLKKLLEDRPDIRRLLKE